VARGPIHFKDANDCRIAGDGLLELASVNDAASNPLPLCDIQQYAFWSCDVFCVSVFGA
jgi:hypothetical protein